MTEVWTDVSNTGLDISGIAAASGLDAYEKATADALIDVFQATHAANMVKRSYYDGSATARDLGINTIPDSVTVSVSCDWPRKAVTAVAERSRFEGFILADGGRSAELDAVMLDSRLASRYKRSLNGELVHGCMCAAVGRFGNKPIVRFHSAEQSAMIWDVGNDRLASGLVIADARRTDWSGQLPVPVKVNMHMPGRLVTFDRLDADSWAASSMATPLDGPMMVAFANNADDDQPLGHSRVSKFVRDISDEFMRIFEYMAVSGALNSAPQKFLLGLTEDNFNAFASDKRGHYIGSWILATLDDEGNRPQVGQLPQSSPQPYIDTLRLLATLFSGATGVPINSLGIIQDNPSSAQAIAASREDICVAADDLNAANGESLLDVALMAMAVANNQAVDELPKAVRGARAEFASPLYRSLAEETDSAMKLASVADGYSKTLDFWKSVGKDDAEAAGILSDLERLSALEMLDGIASGAQK